MSNKSESAVISFPKKANLAELRHTVLILLYWCVDTEIYWNTSLFLLLIPAGCVLGTLKASISQSSHQLPARSRPPRKPRLPAITLYSILHARAHLYPTSSHSYLQNNLQIQIRIPRSMFCSSWRSWPGWWRKCVDIALQSWRWCRRRASAVRWWPSWRWGWRLGSRRWRWVSSQ